MLFFTLQKLSLMLSTLEKVYKYVILLNLFSRCVFLKVEIVGWVHGLIHPSLVSSDSALYSDSLRSRSIYMSENVFSESSFSSCMYIDNVV